MNGVNSHTSLQKRESLMEKNATQFCIETRIIFPERRTTWNPFVSLPPPHVTVECVQMYKYYADVCMEM